MRLLKYHKYNTKKINLFFLATFLLISTTYAQKYTVVLDAGHGGKDPGASSKGRIEKKIALSVVLKAGKILEKNPKIKVVYTRKSDVFIELHKRAKIANKKGADLFVSVHCNANNKSHPHGAETYVLGLKGNAQNMAMVKKENAVVELEDNYKKNYDYNPNSPESVIGLSVLQEENLDASVAFAGMTQKNFAKARRKDRSVQQANFLVLRETIMPSVLIELGFLTNNKEGGFLNSKAGQNAMGKAIADAVTSYTNQLAKNSVPYVKSVKPKKTEKTKTKVKTKPKKSKVPIKKSGKSKTNKNLKKGIEYSVQIAASKIYLKEDGKRFRGLKNVKIKKVGSYYRYFYGSTSKYNRINNYLLKAKKAGIKDSFIVAFKNGKKISVKTAKKME